MCVSGCAELASYFKRWNKCNIKYKMRNSTLLQLKKYATLRRKNDTELHHSDIAEGSSLEKAVELAISECIEKNILVDILRQNRAEALIGEVCV